MNAGRLSRSICGKKMKNSHARYAVLLAGGEGSRFWPQSRTLEPKQFLSLDNGRSLFRQSIERVISLIPSTHVYVVASEIYKDVILHEVSFFNIPSSHVIFEPLPKNTAPAIALAMKIISDEQKDDKAKVVVFPCDHLIKHKDKFALLLGYAFDHCGDKLVVFGIPPHRPATGYGYIHADKTKIVGCSLMHKVVRFCEKPDVATAQKFCNSGNYFWNSGIFAGAVGSFLRVTKECLPDLFRKICLVRNGESTEGLWKKIIPISFDYGILEKTKNLAMVRADRLGWSDLGSWQAWDELQKKDKDENIFLADSVDFGSRNLTVVGEDRLIATLGLKDLIVVDTPDALLIMAKDKSEDVKKVVSVLKKNQRPEHYCHKMVKRPWGSYTVLDSGQGFKIKLVRVYPHKSLSLQWHKKRSEHWVVVEGIAKITKDKKCTFVKKNQSTFIPAGCIHRIENPGSKILKIVEVQAGAFLSEDDIFRLKDDFGRGGRY